MNKIKHLATRLTTRTINSANRLLFYTNNTSSEFPQEMETVLPVKLINPHSPQVALPEGEKGQYVSICRN